MPILHSIETMPHRRASSAGRVQRSSCIQAELHTARPPHHRDPKAELRMATCGYQMVKTSTRDERKVPCESETPPSIAEAPSPKKPSAPRERSNVRDIERLHISRLWNDFAQDLSENRTHAARELFNDRPARTLLLKIILKNHQFAGSWSFHGELHAFDLIFDSKRLLAYMPSILSSTSA